MIKNFFLFGFIILTSIHGTGQDTIDFNQLNKRMPLTLNEKIIYLDNVTPYTGISSLKDSLGNVLRINSFKNGLMHGNQIKYYQDQSIKEITPYKSGRRDGSSEIYYSSGNIKSRMKFKDGSLSDTSKFWFENGQLQLLSLENRENPDVSYFCSFYENGTKEAEFINGIQTTWHPNGKIKTQGKMSMGRPDGELKIYDKKGKLIRTEIWEKGKKISEKK